MRYDLLAREAMRGVIRLALERAASPEGLPGDHHFYVSFVTAYPGVVLPRRLAEQYPDEMSIVLKRHYWDLEVGHEGFSVGLSFDQKRETIGVPYPAITRFLDPEAQFVLQFPRPPVPSSNPDGPSEEPDGSKVVSLDAFRKR